MVLEYPLTVQKVGSHHIADFPDIPGARSEGDTINAAIMRARTAFRKVIEGYLKTHLVIPMPSLPKSGQYVVALTDLQTTIILEHNQKLELHGQNGRK